MPIQPPKRKQWVTPKVECLEVRPEVTAYAGDGSRPLASS